MSRAVHAHRPTRIKRSADEHADLVALRRARDAAQVRELMAAAGRGDVEMTVYTSQAEAYADLGLGGSDR
ncbi:hypothetical protein ACFWYW_44895 [Nonomuraea sp. NPDC059023]|uniref:hypothetical protein n=1 Tax=unclassified Nonomuraea TaxID=2593643 RepID=UPI00368C43A3